MLLGLIRKRGLQMIYKEKKTLAKKRTDKRSDFKEATSSEQ